MLKRLQLDPKNRMVRVGLGLHDGAWFFRVDLWWFGFRLTGSEDVDRKDRVGLKDKALDGAGIPRVMKRRR